MKETTAGRTSKRRTRIEKRRLQAEAIWVHGHGKEECAEQALEPNVHVRTDGGGMRLFSHVSFLGFLYEDDKLFEKDDQKSDRDVQRGRKTRGLCLALLQGPALWIKRTMRSGGKYTKSRKFGNAGRNPSGTTFLSPGVSLTIRRRCDGGCGKSGAALSYCVRNGAWQGAAVYRFIKHIPDRQPKKVYPMQAVELQCAGAARALAETEKSKWRASTALFAKAAARKTKTGCLELLMCRCSRGRYLAQSQKQGRDPDRHVFVRRMAARGQWCGVFCRIWKIPPFDQCAQFAFQLPKPLCIIFLRFSSSPIPHRAK